MPTLHVRLAAGVSLALLTLATPAVASTATSKAVRGMTGDTISASLPHGGVLSFDPDYRRTLTLQVGEFTGIAVKLPRSKGFSGWLYLGTSHGVQLVLLGDPSLSLPRGRYELRIVGSRPHAIRLTAPSDINLTRVRSAGEFSVESSFGELPAAGRWAVRLPSKDDATSVFTVGSYGRAQYVVDVAMCVRPSGSAVPCTVATDGANYPGGGSQSFRLTTGGYQRHQAPDEFSGQVVSGVGTSADWAYLTLAG